MTALLAKRRPGRAPQELVPCGDDVLVSLLTAYVEAGLSKFVLVPTEPPESWRDELTWLASVVHPPQD